MVFSGTLIQSGNGKAVIFATGQNTQIGSLATLTQQTSGVDTPIRREINYFIKVISTIAISLGITFFILAFLLQDVFLASLIFAIGIIVANVPEGLLPTVTLALSLASKRMASRNALIKQLESVETLGSTTVICTDKTGTLTQNKMAVNSIMKMDDVIGHRYQDMYILYKENPGKSPVLKVLESGNEEFGEVVTQDGKVWTVTAIPIKNEDGRITGVLKTGLDITVHRRSEERLIQAKLEAEEANNSKSEFLTNVSHDNKVLPDNS